MVRVLLNVPKRVKRGEAFDVKLLISHPMESGQRRDDMGRNPFLSFAVTVQASGTLAMTFVDDHGTVQTETASITVE
jgi:sulfur-oxidizing protein SoxZ